MAFTLTAVVALIQVFDMPEALRFYCDVLGFAVVDASPTVEVPEGRFSHWVWLRRDAADLMLNTAYDAAERPPARDAAREAAHGDTGLFIGCADLDAVFARLQLHGVAAEPPRVAPYGMRQLFVRDPDGYSLCLQSPVAT